MKIKKAKPVLKWAYVNKQDGYVYWSDMAYSRKELVSNYGHYYKNERIARFEIREI